MAKTGPKPKPTAQKILEGNPGKRKLNQNEPKLQVALPDPPKELTDVAIEEWKRIAPELFRAKMLTNADRGILAAYCQAWADWLHARERIDINGMVEVSEKGYMYQSPWVGIANKAMANMMKIASEFGLTPSARTQLKVTPDPPKNPEEEKADRILD